jgi:hypothetical protein
VICNRGCSHRDLTSSFRALFWIIWRRDDLSLDLVRCEHEIMRSTCCFSFRTPNGWDLSYSVNYSVSQFCDEDLEC